MQHVDIFGLKPHGDSFVFMQSAETCQNVVHSWMFINASKWVSRTSMQRVTFIAWPLDKKYGLPQPSLEKHSQNKTEGGSLTVA